MKISFYSHLWLILGLTLSFACFLPSDGAAAEKITGTYKFEGIAKARGPDGNSKKKYKGKMRVAKRSVRLQIPISRNGKVVACKRMIKAKLKKRLKRNPSRASGRATFVNASCGISNWTGTIRLKWVEHPEGYAVSFSLGGINGDDVNVEQITGRFTGSTGTLATEENAPEIPEVPVVPVVPVP